MKFLLCRSSDWRHPDSPPPCPLNAELCQKYGTPVLEKFEREFANGSKDQLEAWFIELADSQLISFMGDVGSLVVGGYYLNPTIIQLEIYDDYREA